MRFIKITSIRNIGFGVLALLATLSLVYAEQPHPSGRGEHPSKAEPAQRSEPVQRSEPSRTPVEHGAATVNRVNHGSIRHVDTQVDEHPIAVHRDVEVHQHVIVHHDVDVDVNRPRLWHGFVFGARRHDLREGYVRIFVNNAPYFYDDGIYYQQVGDDYQEVYPPIGANIVALPDGAIEVEAGDLAYYYAAGAFYVPQEGGFIIVAPPMGVVVPELPPGAVQEYVNGGVAYQFNGVHYQPVFVNGVTQYMTFTL